MLNDEQREQLNKILRLYFEDLPEWKYRLMVKQVEQVAALETVCVPDE